MKVRSIGDFEKGPIEAWEEQRKRPWQPYVDAVLGFRNHWYPAFFSHELKEGDVSTGSGEPVKEFKSLTMLGERIIFRRLDGKVYAMQDWCLHRGVPFSARPECYTKERLTCWYHGFTYNLLDGRLVDILTEPGSKMIGKIGIRTYPVAEAKGIVFVFIAHVAWPVVLLIAVGSTLGGVLGAKVGRKLPPPVLRGVIVVVGLVAIGKLVLG